MSIRGKIILILCLAFTTIISITIIYTGISLFKTCEITEKRMVQKNSRLILRILDSEVDAIDTICKDWAYWDDSYSFVVDKNEEYVKSNLVNETFGDLKLNLIVFLDNNRKVVYAKAYDWRNESVLALPSNLTSFLRNINSESRGIVNLGKPMLISIRYILPSNESGNPRGYLIFGRFLDDYTLRKMSRITGEEVALIFPPKYLKLTYKKIGRDLRVYIPLTDLKGDVIADINFSIYPFWEDLANYALLAQIFGITISALSVSLAVLYLVNSDLRRLLALKKFVDEAKEDLKKRFITKGDDEISELAKGINSMLDRICVLNEGLKFTNRLLRHDILNKLSVIIGYSEIGKVERNTDYFDKITHIAEDAAKLIVRVRELEKAFLSFEPKEVNLREVIKDIIKNYDVDWSLKGDGCILADDGIYSVIDNIIHNAIKHGKTDKIDFEIEDLDDCIELRIKDYGKGIPDEYKERIFEEDFSTSGSGLGLYIVKKLVEIYKGSIKVKDNHPSGAIFVLTFPKC